MQAGSRGSSRCNPGGRGLGWGTWARWLPALWLLWPGWYGLCSPFYRPLSLINRHNISCALWPPDSRLLLWERPEGRPFLILWRPESDRRSKERDGSHRGCEQHLKEKCPSCRTYRSWKHFCMGIGLNQSSDSNWS